MGTYYSGERDGSIDDYLKKCKSMEIPFTFTGSEPFEQLREYIQPNVSTVRLYTDGGFDRHYSVTSDYQLEGLEVAAHSGTPGIHDPIELLETVRYWEIKPLSKQ